jgi:hypothetical protein
MCWWRCRPGSAFIEMQGHATSHQSEEADTRQIYRERPFIATGLSLLVTRVRTELYENKRQVRNQTVEKALRAVAKTILLAGCNYPRRTHGTKDLHFHYSSLVKSLKADGPAHRPQLALPVATVVYAATPVT